MNGVMNIDVLMNLVCSASLLSRDLTRRPDTCVLADRNILATPRNISSVSELCLKPGCIKKDSSKATHLSVNVGHLANLLNISSDYDYCLTPACAKAANKIFFNLDLKVKPCDNFYRFACGGWIKRHAKKQKSDISVFIKLQRDMDLKLKYLLEEELTGKEPSFISMVNDLYHSCMDEDGLKETGIMDMMQNLDYLGGWAMVDGAKWIPQTLDWIKVLIRIRNLGHNHNILMKLSVTEDPDNNTAHIIELGKPLFAINGKYLLRNFTDRVINRYQTSMTRIAEVLGSEPLPVEQTNRAIKFEMALAKMSLLNVEQRKKDMHKKYTVRQLMDEVNKIDWIRYFNGLLNTNISENEIILVEDIHFVKKFADFMETVDRRTMLDYMVWRVVHQSLPFLWEEMRDLRFAPRRILIESRHEECLASLRDNLGIALSSYYVRNYRRILQKKKRAAQEYLNYVHQEFIRILEKADWLSKKTKDMANAKVRSTTSYTVYPKQLLNDSLVSDVYKDLKINIIHYYNNSLKVLKWLTDNSYSQLRKANIKGDWRKYAKSTVMYGKYHVRDNIIELPAGIFQQPIFSRNRPRYLNFGSIGFLIGHEIAHALSYGGRRVDKDGNNRKWFDTADENTLRTRTQCIVEQYNNYTAVGEIKRAVNGVKTLEENIADITALKVAYQAYQTWVRHHGREPKLPGLKYTPNQLFWISTANMWCERMSPSTLENIMSSGNHSPSEFRIIGPLSNLPEFAKDFNCKPDSAMVRKNRCEVW